jgi:hypothetical protein
MGIVKKLPSYVPTNYDSEKFSGNYHTDILIPDFVTQYSKPTDETNWQWKNVYFDFYTDHPVGSSHPNYGQWVGKPVPNEAIYFNPWHPEQPQDIPWEQDEYWDKLKNNHAELL